MTGKRLLSIIVGILVVGGLVMFFNMNEETKEEYEAKLFRQEQENIAQYLTEHYENIRKIDFLSAEKDSKTGFTDVLMEVNSEMVIMVSFGDYGDDDYVITFYEHGAKFVDRSSSSIANRVDVNYIDGDS
ncbi:TPA: hypothetical protein U2D59_001908 [Streptococcus suis]|uniref:hypothetical protein n=1 Tax=Streptococcus suis TaxID=1307 RepID=UPI0020B74E60|nr:hypothetical protein [Streptococcus suis]MCP8328007.1 hypothetical protein [Streptococcus suis]MCP8638641.1 hypothetical protein [Streptococcus suis]MCP8640856.1 hypothetical protein [Streptococcus suis]MCP8642899.1 hypothetical protein [Streptococcus suis]MCP8644999.1 hypothetical protein [Streptococcus suis]